MLRRMWMGWIVHPPSSIIGTPVTMISAVAMSYSKHTYMLCFQHITWQTYCNFLCSSLMLFMLVFYHTCKEFYILAVLAMRLTRKVGIATFSFEDLLRQMFKELTLSQVNVHHIRRCLKWLNSKLNTN